MMNSKSSVFALICTAVSLFPAAVPAQVQDDSETKTYYSDEIVITATKTETPHREVASSVTVIGARELESLQQMLVLDVLRTVAGLDVSQLGGRGGQTSIFMRGANSNHTLVLIDGVEALDPISPGKSFDFASLTTDNIERIEILRGPQSTLYGSDAIAGVISIFTKKGSGHPRYSLSSEAGSFNSFNNRFTLSGGGSLVSYSASLSRFDSDGISAAHSAGSTMEKDGFSSTVLSTRVSFTTGENSDFDVAGRYVKTGADLDNFGGPAGDDPNNFLDQEQLYLRMQGRVLFIGSLWEQKYGVSYTDLSRTNTNEPDPDHPASSLHETSTGNILKFDWQNNLFLGSDNTVTFGVETEEETGSSETGGDYSSIFAKKSARTTGVYAQEKLSAGENFFASAGIRIDNHSRFGSKTTFRLAPVFIVPRSNTKVRGTFGTGFKSPSLFQLHSVFGDENLRPEESRGWEFGLEQPAFKGNLTFEIGYFRTDFDNLIDFDTGTFTYKNIGEAETKGVELSAMLHTQKGVTVSAHYTYTDSEDAKTRENLLRRARHKAGLDIRYEYAGRGHASLAITAVGKRDDLDFSTFPAVRVVLDGYVLVNAAVSYDLTDHIQAFGRVDNLFDTDYVQILGYGTYGAAGYGGLTVHF